MTAVLKCGGGYISSHSDLYQRNLDLSERVYSSKNPVDIFLNLTSFVSDFDKLR